MQPDATQEACDSDDTPVTRAEQAARVLFERCGAAHPRVSGHVAAFEAAALTEAIAFEAAVAYAMRNEGWDKLTAVCYVRLLMEQGRLAASKMGLHPDMGAKRLRGLVRDVLPGLANRALSLDAERVAAESVTRNGPGSKVFKQALTAPLEVGLGKDVTARPNLPLVFLGPPNAVTAAIWRALRALVRQPDPLKLLHLSAAPTVDKDPKGLVVEDVFYAPTEAKEAIVLAPTWDKFCYDFTFLRSLLKLMKERLGGLNAVVVDDLTRAAPPPTVDPTMPTSVLGRAVRALRLAKNWCHLQKVVVVAGLPLGSAVERFPQELTDHNTVIRVSLEGGTLHAEDYAGVTVTRRVGDE